MPANSGNHKTLGSSFQFRNNNNNLISAGIGFGSGSALTAGVGIDINNNVISTDLVAGTGITFGINQHEITINTKYAGQTFGQYLYYNPSANDFVVGGNNITIGNYSGQTNQATNAISLGFNAGNFNQQSNAISIGVNTGQTNQGQSSVSIGKNSGNYSQGQFSIAIGEETAQTFQSDRSVAIGYRAGQNYQLNSSVAIGNQAGQNTQANNSVAIGPTAGQNNQLLHGIAIGPTAGQNSQGTDGIAIGYTAGQHNQGSSAISIGYSAGQNNQGSSAISIGTSTGQNYQQNHCIAIGNNAGQHTQGTHAIALGYYAGQTSQPSNSIVINATSSTNLNAPAINSLVITPMRVANAGPLANPQILLYSTASGEIAYSTAITTTSKTFVIDHPTYTDKYLVHACLEGPEAGVYYRGESKITEIDNGIKTIVLPEYTKTWKEHSITITPINTPNLYYVSKIYDQIKFNVYGNVGEFYWMVHAKRCDINIEPLKSDIIVKGDGPYKWI